MPAVDGQDYTYQLVKVNVDHLKLIQIGITLFDKEGRMPEGAKSWQFNFKFDLEKEDNAQESIDVLKEANIQFDKHKTDGIDHFQFAESGRNFGEIHARADRGGDPGFHGEGFCDLHRMLTDVDRYGDLRSQALHPDSEGRHQHRPEKTTMKIPSGPSGRF